MIKFGRTSARVLGERLLRFLLVGGGGAMLYAGVCTLLVQILPAYKAAISVGVHATLIPVIYVAQSRVTFRNARTSLDEFVRYALLQIASITASTFLLVRLVTENSLLNLGVFLAIAATAALISFVVCNVFVFRAAPNERDVSRAVAPASSDQ